MKNRKQQVLVAAALTGAVSMIYELVWVRYLGLVLGNSVYAAGTVTACYMAGVALGDFILGSWTVRHYKKVRTITFAGLAFCCLLSPVIYKAICGLNQAGAGVFGAVGGGIIWRALVSFLALLFPTALIGGILPVLIGGAAAEDGKVYAVNTLGSVAGAVFTGFFLIPEAGLSGSMAAAAGLLACSWILVRNLEPEACVEREIVKEETPYSQKEHRLALAVYGISGFTGMAFQIYQTKMLTLFFMDSVYDFAVILAVYIAGLFLGNLISSVWAKRTSKHMEILAGSQILLGICSVFSLYLVSRFPYWTDGLASQNLLYEQFGNRFFAVGILRKIGFTALLLLLPAVLWGMAYPMVSWICGGKRRENGRRAGIILGWNTVCSAAGSFLATFCLTGLLGLQNAVKVNACLNLTAGLLLILGASGNQKRKVFLAAGTAALSAAVLVGVPEWDRFEMSTSFLKPGQDVEDYVDIRYYKEDMYGITSVVDFLPYNETYLTTNRLYCQNTSNMTGPEDHRRLSYIPLMLHRNPKDVLVEGLGAGVTLCGAEEYGNVEIDCVEISGAVAEAAREFSQENHNVLDSEAVNLVIDDARNYLLTTEKYYDVIIADIFFPMSSGSGNMFSREYYESCLGRLKEGGLMAQWIPLHQFSSEELEITMKTFSEVFPNTTVWFGMIGKSVPVVGLIGSRDPLSVSFDRIAAFYDGRKEHRMDLGNTALDDPYMFLSHFVKVVQAEGFADETPCNTDNRPILEYLNPAGAKSYWERGIENIEKLLTEKMPAEIVVDFSEGGSKALLADYERQTEEFIRKSME